MRALLQYKAVLIESVSEGFLTYSYISGLTWEQEWLGALCASSQCDQTLLFCISSEMDVHT